MVIIKFTFIPLISNPTNKKIKKFQKKKKKKKKNFFFF